MQTKSVLLAAFCVAALGGCMDMVVTNRYSTLEAARADHLFERGWLPDILPGSARDIRTTNDLDINVSSGRFEFSDTDSSTFFRSLELGAPEEAPLSHWSDTLREYRASGYVAWTYRGDGTWVFFCHASRDECDYVLWT